MAATMTAHERDMTGAFDVHRQSKLFSAYALQEVFGKPIEAETPQSRLKQVGMLTVLYMMHQNHRKLTLSNIIEVTGLTRNGAAESINPLIQRGILSETIVKNSMGRGTARQFEFSASVFDRLT